MAYTSAKKNKKRKEKRGPQVESIRGEAIICFDPEFFSYFFHNVYEDFLWLFEE
jgi:hypothetical protein